MLKLNLQLFSEESGVDEVPVAEVQTTEVQEPETGVDSQPAAEAKEPNNFEKAFAKRLAAEKTKWESSVQEKYKDYEDSKYLADYFREINGNADALTLKEQIEMERLQARAEQNNVPPEVMKRLEELEAKAAKADEYDQQNQAQRAYNEFRTKLDAFAKEKGIEADPIQEYMVQNQIGNIDVAYKAMRADQLEKELASAKENAVKEYIQSKSAPKVEGAGTPGIVVEDTSKMSWGDITKRAAARIQAMNNPN